MSARMAEAKRWHGYRRLVEMALVDALERGDDATTYDVHAEAVDAAVRCGEVWSSIELDLLSEPFGIDVP